MASKADFPTGSFATGLRNQANVIGALIMRELHTRYGRDNIGYLWVIFEPMTLAIGVAIIHAAHPGRTGSDISAIALGTLGYCVFIMFRGIFTRAEGAIESNTPLLYHRMVTIFDIMFSRALLEGAGCSVSLFVLLFFGNMLGVAGPPNRPLYLLLALLLMMLFSFAAGMLACAWSHDNKLAARIIHPGTYLLMPLSGGFYMLSWVPQPYQNWLWHFPMVQIFEMARYGQFRAASGNFFSIPYIVGSIMLMTLCGMSAIRVMRKHIHL